MAGSQEEEEEAVVEVEVEAGETGTELCTDHLKVCDCSGFFSLYIHR